MNTATHDIFAILSFGLAALASLSGCASTPRVGDTLPRTGDEIVIAGQYFHTGVPVVLWTDPGGYDAYRVEKRFAPWESSDWKSSAAGLDSPNRYGLRVGPTESEREAVRGGGWPLALLQQHVDQFVIHYDVCGTSRTCFRVLHDQRGLSVHFMLDLDGTIYQTLDVKERAWHASIANDRSVGIEIAHIGAYPPGKPSPLDTWYVTEEGPEPITRVVLPERLGDGGIRTPNFVATASRAGRILGEINGSPYEMHDLTNQQYHALAHLTAALNAALPRLEIQAPRDADGRVLTRTLTPAEFASYSGLIGHFHVTQNKVDPGPAFDWQRVLDQAREIRNDPPRVGPLPG